MSFIKKTIRSKNWICFKKPWQNSPTPPPVEKVAEYDDARDDVREPYLPSFSLPLTLILPNPTSQ